MLSDLGVRMLDSDWQVVRADLRLQLRKVNAELERIEHESQQFQKLGFSSDVLDMTARAHLDRRQDILAQLKSIERRDRRSRAGGQSGLIGWLLLPAVLCMMCWRSLVNRFA
jgi:hypothetical protein